MSKSKCVMKQLTVPGACLFLISSLFLTMPAQADPKKLSEAEAIRVAEQFIADNGYTKAKPKAGKLDPESLNRGRSRKDELDLRHDTLEPHAYGVFDGGNLQGWGVVFRHSQRVFELLKNVKTTDENGKEAATVKERPTGRVLMMDPTGKKCMIMHKDFFLDNEFKHLQGNNPSRPAKK